MEQCEKCGKLRLQDAAKPVQGIDLGQFRDSVVQARCYYAKRTFGREDAAAQAGVENCDRLLALIDQRGGKG